MINIQRASAFGKQAAQVGRALPFSESLGGLDEVEEPFAGALRSELADEEARLIIHSPAFASAALVSPENLLVLTATRWIMTARTATGTLTTSAPFSAAARISLTMILLGGQIVIESVAGSARCSVSFNMVSIDLFREAAFIVMAGASVQPGQVKADAPLDGNLEQLSFKFRNALAEQLPPGQTLRSVRSWERVIPRFAHLLFLRPSAPSGVLAITDQCVCLITDPQAGREKQPKGSSPHGKVVTYLLRQHPLRLHLPPPQSSGDVRIRLDSGDAKPSPHWSFGVPVRQAPDVIAALQAWL